MSLIPAGAADAWRQLTEALDQAGTTPCQRDPEAWWAAADQQAALDAAVARCWACPARQACLAYALAAGEQHGVWGATAPADRMADAA